MRLPLEWFRPLSAITNHQRLAIRRERERAKARKVRRMDGGARLGKEEHAAWELDRALAVSRCFLLANSHFPNSFFVNFFFHLKVPSKAETLETATRGLIRREGAFWPRNKIKISLL
jgi:hypothetical protein